MAKKKNGNRDNLEPQKSSAAQFITYIASTGASNEKYELRYEDENIWMSQKMLAAVYGVEVNSVNYHIKKLFADAELDEDSVIRKIRITGSDGKSYSVNHYNLQVIIALGFKIDNERAVQFRKWANEIVSQYTIRGYVIDMQRMKDGSPISVNAYLEFAENAAKRHIPMTMEAWEKRLDKFVELWDGPITIEHVKKVSASIALNHAESEFEKYRIIQDKLFLSDYDRYLLALEEEAKKGKK